MKGGPSVFDGRHSICQVFHAYVATVCFMAAAEETLLRIKAQKSLVIRSLRRIESIYLSNTKTFLWVS